MKVIPVLAAILLSAAPAAVHAQVQAEVQLEGDAPLLTLNVTETVDSKPDLATIGVGVQTTAPTATDALRQNSEKMDALIRAIKARGVADRDIQTSGISLGPQYDYERQQPGTPPRFIGYQVSNEVRVRTRDIARLGQTLDALVAAGGNSVNGPNFTLERDDAAQTEARRRALAAAKAQADFYARTLGYGSARLIAVSETMGPAMFNRMPAPVVAQSNTRGDMAAPIEPGQVQTSVTLTAQYRLER